MRRELPSRTLLERQVRETFKLPDPNTDGVQYINEPGMLHGVSGTYSCQPTTPAAGCTATVAAKGFTLGGRNVAVHSLPTRTPRSWIRRTRIMPPTAGGFTRPESGKEFTASAFVDEKGTVAPRRQPQCSERDGYVHGRRCRQVRALQFDGRHERRRPLHRERATLEADFQRQ